ncbi:MAG: ABC transporter permease [Candidatus Accumulibacter sp.]|uniref:Transport permease protein n=3 Tax=Candidatus Accumulibacter TaxID=327159 RepID=A0A7D5SE30_9PROT|nr:ABC transporter permease [Accumulibacter sp.]QLH49864.1 MAG: ABC transporter permease [Candidatus Accumulibacter cognatus]TMQ78773.1 O-antigen export system permease protein RfbD [Candidatus Accumulibacter phosphatis]HNE19859.1 ABC transporter permease [Turneriella sp.]MBL8402393.1 ABC transporter permease [Accumulibacter sp.]MBN8517535.1 ABC transporter permease [Accumulibacter sp.]
MNPHQRHPATPSAMVLSLWHNRQLIIQMTRREVIGRYRGSIMGLAWSFFNPVLLLLVYTFVFSIVFKARWGTGAEESRADFAILLFIGMIIHGVFSECVNRAPSLIVGNVSYVKKVVFPLQILPLVALGSALFHAAVSIVVLLVAKLLVHGSVPWTLLFLPMALLPLLIGTLGIAWVLAALGVFIRDIGQITSLLTTVLLFISPVFYPISSLPAKYQQILLLNPLTFVIEESRRIMFFGTVPDFQGFLLATGVSLLMSWAGFWWFQRTRKGFADVL